MSLPLLQTLNLSGCCQLSDGALAHVARMRSLRDLALGSSDGEVLYTDAGIQHLTALRELENLEIAYAVSAHE